MDLNISDNTLWAIALAMIILTATPAGIGSSSAELSTEYSIDITGSMDVPAQTVETEWGEPTITQIGKEETGETLEVSTDVPEDESYAIRILETVDGDRRNLKSEFVEGDVERSFFLDRYDPGTYIIALTQDGGDTAVAFEQFVVKGYAVDQSVSDVTKGDILNVDIQLTEVSNRAGNPQAVNVTLHGNNVTRSTKATKTSKNSYEANFPTNELSTGSYNVYAGVETNGTVFGDSELIGLSDSRSITIGSNERHPQTDIDTSDLPGDGTSTDPYEISNASELQAMEDDLSANYELVSDIDASSTAQFNNRSGFDPVGPSFSGSLGGDGHTITGLTIDRPDETGVGLFRVAGNGATLADLTLANTTVTGNADVGGIVGRNQGTITNASVSGSVTGTGEFSTVGGLVGFNVGNVTNARTSSNVTGDEYVGGLVGDNRGSIQTVTVSGSVNGTRRVGGVIGYNDYGGTAQNTTVAGNVTGTETVGGVIGFNDAIIIETAASGSVTGSDDVGGVIGFNSDGGRIQNATASVSVTGRRTVGGLIGDNRGTVITARTAGDATGERRVGGLIGYNDNNGTVQTATVSGNVTGNETIGGVVGFNSDDGTVQTATVSGSVSGDETVGGAVGFNSGLIQAVRVTGNVTGGNFVGGLVGDNRGTIRDTFAVGGLVAYNDGIVKQSYFDEQTTRLGTSAGNATGLTTAQMQGQAARTNLSGLDFDTIWTTTSEYPALRALSEVGEGSGSGGDPIQVSVFQRSVFPLRPTDNGELAGGTTSRFGTIPNPEFAFQINNTAVDAALAGSDNVLSFNKQSLYVYNKDATIRTTLNPDSTNLGTFTVDQDVQKVAVRVREGGQVPSSIDGLGEFLTSSPESDAQLRGTIGSNDISRDFNGNPTFNFNLSDEESGQYFLAIAQIDNSSTDNKPGLESGNDPGNITAASNVTFIGVDQFLLRDAPSEVQAASVVAPGETVPVSVDASNLSSPTVSHTVAIMDEPTLSNQRSVVNLADQVDQDTASVASSIETVDGVTNIDPDTTLAGSTVGENRFLGTRDIDTGFSPLVGEGSINSLVSLLVGNRGNVTPIEGRESVSLFASVTGTVGDQRDTLEVQTTDNFSPGQYSLLHFATAQNGTTTLSTKDTIQIVDGTQLNITAEPHNITVGETVTVTVTNPETGDPVANANITYGGNTQSGTGVFTTNASGQAVFAPRTSGTTTVDKQPIDGQPFITETIDLRVETQSENSSQRVDIDPSDLPGDGTSTDPYEISNVSELQAMEDDLDANYELVSDIDASQTAQFNNASGFDPIGLTSTTFSGSFTGNGHTVTGLTINRPDENQVGLFGVNSGSVRNITLTEMTVTGNNTVGGVIGENGGTLQNATASGNVNGSKNIGGLVGNNGLSSTVQSAISSGSVNGTENVGGLVGKHRGTIQNTKASASVTGSHSIGGLVGIVRFGSVTRSFAIGTVSGTTDTGGLVGKIPQLDDSTLGTVEYSYWDTQTTDQNNSDGTPTGLPTEQMQGELAEIKMDELAFGRVWKTQPNDYPALIAQQETNPPQTQTQPPISVTFANQTTSNGSTTITVDSAQFGNQSVPGEDFVVVVHETTQSTYGTEIGAKVGESDVLSAGNQTDITVDLATTLGSTDSLTELTNSQSLVAMLHRADTDDSDNINHGDHITRDGAKVTDRAQITVDDSEQNQPDRSAPAIEDITILNETVAEGDPLVATVTVSDATGVDDIYLEFDGVNSEQSIYFNRPYPAYQNTSNGTYRLVMNETVPQDTYRLDRISVSDTLDNSNNVYFDNSDPSFVPSDQNVTLKGPDDRSAPAIEDITILNETVAEGDPLVATVTVSDATGVDDIYLEFDGVNSKQSIYFNRPYPAYQNTSNGTYRLVMNETVPQDTYRLDRISVSDTLDNSNNVYFDNSDPSFVPSDQNVTLKGPDDRSAPVIEDVTILNETVAEDDPLVATVTVNDATGVDDIYLEFDGVNSEQSIYFNRPYPAYQNTSNGTYRLVMNETVPQDTYRLDRISVSDTLDNSNNVYFDNSDPSFVPSDLTVELTSEPEVQSTSVTISNQTVSNGSTTVTVDSVQFSDQFASNEEFVIVVHETTSSSYGTEIGPKVGESGVISPESDSQQDIPVNLSTTLGSTDSLTELTNSRSLVAMLHRANTTDGNNINHGDHITRDGAKVTDRAQITVSSSDNGDVLQIDVDPNNLPGDGTSTDPYEISNVSELQAMEDDLDANYELVGNINASQTVEWNDRRGFDPIGNFTDAFTGSFDGNNHTIMALTINRPTESDVGLFGVTDSETTLTGVALTSVTTTGGETTGGLVGTNTGSIQTARASGNVTGDTDVGGLVGANDNGTIRNAIVSGSVTATGRGEFETAGGLVGTSNDGLIQTARSSVSVNGSDYATGGLVGANGVDAAIENASASGSVAGEDDVGGLVGLNNENITNVSASGSVTGTDVVGGLVGQNSFDATIQNASASGSVTGDTNVGGLVGSLNNDGSVESVTASGSVAGEKNVGGLVGVNGEFGTVAKVTSATASGSVTGTKNVGGLVGRNLNKGTIQDTFAVGVVSGDSDVGGLVGNNTATGTTPGTVEQSYFDTRTTGRTTSAGGTGLTTAQMQGTAAVSNMNLAFGESWQTVSGDYPTLTLTQSAENNPAVLSVQPSTTSVQPNGSFTVEIVVNQNQTQTQTQSPQPVFGAQTSLAYNTSVLDAVNVTKGTFLSADGVPTTVQVAELNETAGVVNYGEVRQTTTEGGISGSGVLFTVTFEPTQSVSRGTQSQLTLEDVILSTATGESIPIQPANATATIPLNQPPSVNATLQTAVHNVNAPIVVNATASDAETTVETVTLRNRNPANQTQPQAQQQCQTPSSSCEVELTTTPTESSWNGTGYEQLIYTLAASDTDNLTGTDTVATPIYIPGDANGDGIVNIFDSVAVGSSWKAQRGQQSYSDAGDLNNDGIINIFDSVAIGSNWQTQASVSVEPTTTTGDPSQQETGTVDAIDVDTATATNTNANTDATLSVEPQTTTLPFQPESASTESFTVEVVATVNDSSQSVFGTQASLEYDTSVLNVTAVNSGSFLSADGVNTAVQAAEANETSGVVNYAETRTTTEGGISGSGTLFTVTFEPTQTTTATATQPTVSRLNLTDVILSTATQQSLSVQLQNGAASNRELVIQPPSQIVRGEPFAVEVFNSAGEPVSGAPVTLIPGQTSGSDNGNQTATTNASGVAVFTLPADTETEVVELAASSDGLTTYVGGAQRTVVGIRDPGDLQVENLSVNSPEVTVGNSVTVSAEITNTNQTDLNQTLTITANKTGTLLTRTVTIPGNTTQQFSLTPTFSTIDTQTLSVNGQSAGTVTVTEITPPTPELETPQLTLSSNGTDTSSSVDLPAEVNATRDANLTVPLTNRGDEPGEFTLNLTVADGNGDILSPRTRTRTLEVNATQTQTVTFEDVTGGLSAQPTSYAVTVTAISTTTATPESSRNTSVTTNLSIAPSDANNDGVSVDDDESLQITDTRSPARVSDGDRFTVSARIGNFGTNVTTDELSFAVDTDRDGTFSDETTRTQTQTLPANETARVAFQATASSDSDSDSDSGQPPLTFRLSTDADTVTSNLSVISSEFTTAVSTGDPHIVSFDGVAYDFQAAGEFVLAREPTPNGTGSLIVQARQEPLAGSDSITRNTAVATVVNNTTVIIDATDPTPLQINGSAVELNRSDTIAVGNGTGEITRTQDGNTLTITYPGPDDTAGIGDERLTVDLYDDRVDIALSLDPDRDRPVEGVFGPADGNATNDIGLPNGTALAQPPQAEQLYGVFRQSWRVNNSTTLFAYEDDNGPETYYDPTIPAEAVSLADLDPTTRQAAEQRAIDAGLQPGTVAFRNAVLDVALTGDGSYLTSAQQQNTTAETTTVVGAPTESTVRVEPASASASLGPGGTTNLSLILEQAPEGLAGYNLTASVTVTASGVDSTGVRVVGATAPDIFNSSVTETTIGPDNQTVEIRATDINTVVESNATDISLGTITVAANETADVSEVPVTVSVSRIDDDSGSPIDVQTENGTVSVTEQPPLAEGLNPPTDQDSDGVFEDLNGNGRVDFNDVVILFENLPDAEVPFQDVNGNGRIDFDDIVELFKEI